MVSNKEVSVYQEFTDSAEKDFFLELNPWFIYEDAATIAQLRLLASAPCDSRQIIAGPR